MKLSNQKGRAWAFVMYPESMPSNYYELLEQTGLPFAISPLHDKDIEKCYASWKSVDGKAVVKDNIQNVDIYDGLYDI